MPSTDVAKLTKAQLDVLRDADRVAVQDGRFIAYFIAEYREREWETRSISGLLRGLVTRGLVRRDMRVDHQWYCLTERGRMALADGSGRGPSPPVVDGESSRDEPGQIFQITPHTRAQPFWSWPEWLRVANGDGKIWALNKDDSDGTDPLVIKTPDGEQPVEIGDWIVMGDDGLVKVVEKSQ